MRTSGAAFITALLVTGSAALAEPLPAGTIQGAYRVAASSWMDGVSVGEEFKGYISDPISTNITATGGSALATGSISLSATPTPGVFTHAVLLSPPSCGFLCGGGGGFASLSGFEYYAFQILGPTDTVNVHFDAAGHVGIPSISVLSEFVSASSYLRVREGSNGPVVADGSLGVYGDIHGFQDAAFPGIYVASPFHDLIISSDLILKTNTIYEVKLGADIFAFADGGGTTEAFANFDPTFTVHGPYSFVFSDGFGGGAITGVPEPASWALMVLGFGLAGVGIRRRNPYPALT